MSERPSMGRDHRRKDEEHSSERRLGGLLLCSGERSSLGRTWQDAPSSSRAQAWRRCRRALAIFGKQVCGPWLVVSVSCDQATRSAPLEPRLAPLKARADALAEVLSLAQAVLLGGLALERRRDSVGEVTVERRADRPDR